MIPQSQKDHNETIDIIIEACQEIKESKDSDTGEITKELLINPKKVWWKTLIVNSPYLGRFALELEKFENMAKQCYNFMTSERADALAGDIIDSCDAYRYSVDAKSSESLRDKNNTQSTLIDKINKNKIERAYTLKDEGKKSFLQGIMGRDQAKDSNED